MDNSARQRIDTWLFAARFYKTRKIAQEMINGGKVRYNGARCKPSKLIEINSFITLTQGNVEKTVLVKQCAKKRVSAALAQNLYEETIESLQKRVTKKAQEALCATPKTSKPNKKQRREIVRLKKY
tara:strand:+ start:2813 stop:3190 length:378 start_codon:yes stop_codon:yes gene_type:complete